MPIQEQQNRMDKMQVSLKKYNIHHWVRIFMESLKRNQAGAGGFFTKQIDERDLPDILMHFKAAPKRLIFLDYDGTLTGFNVDPQACAPDQELTEIFQGLSKDQKNQFSSQAADRMLP